MYEVVSHPGSVEEALEAPAARREIEPSLLDSIILPSKTLTPAERVEIYHGMYLLRMNDALSADYPGVEHFLGHHHFHHLVSDYVQAYPSSSYTLNRLGDHLPEFIRDHPGLKHRGKLLDLARYELAFTQIFDEDETAPISAEAIAAVPADAWERVRLRPIAAFRLLALRYPVSEYLQSVRMETPHPVMRVQVNHVALFRNRDFAIKRFDLSRREFLMLSHLASGRSLGDAIADVSRRYRRPVTETELFDWFRQWSFGGIFQSIDF